MMVYYHSECDIFSASNYNLPCFCYNCISHFNTAKNAAISKWLKHVILFTQTKQKLEIIIPLHIVSNDTSYPTFNTRKLLHDTSKTYKP